jgi:cullin 1
LQKCIHLFEQFYQRQHSGRKLDWLHSLSRGEIKATFADQAIYHFQVSTYQMIVLIQYNEHSVFTLQELMQRTQLSQDVLSQVLVTFLRSRLFLMEPTESSPSTAVLHSIDEKTLFELQTRFYLNENYHNKRVKVNLNTPLRVEQRMEQEETQKTVEEDRKMLIQASIVRIMKSRRLMRHVALVNEVIEQLQARFQPRVPDIKRCIDLLIEKEYLQRVEGQRDTLSYIV